MTDADAAEWHAATGIRAPVIQTRDSAHRIGQALAELYRCSPPDVATAIAWTYELTERSSPASLLMLLQAAASLSGIDLPTRFSEQDIRSFARTDTHEQNRRVVSPPVQRDGYVEQVFTEYGVAPQQQKDKTHGRAKRA
jgi:hypothetical protein